MPPIKGQVQLQAWIDPDLREEVRERCHVEGVTIKSFVEEALRLAQWIDPELREAVQEQAHRQGITIEEFVQQALRLRLAQVTGDKAGNEKGEATDDH